MHRLTRGKPLGGQQPQHLRQLREASERHVHGQHLQRCDDVGIHGSSRTKQQAPQPPREVTRSVEAVVALRGQQSESQRRGVSERSSDRVTAARGGMQTERCERPSLLPVIGGLSDAIRPNEKAKTERKIAAVRRRGSGTPHTAVNTGADAFERRGERRRLGKREAEWVEKQLQLNSRVAALEKECANGWQQFFAGAGSGALVSTSVYSVSAADVNKQLEELEAGRVNDSRKMRHQLRVLSSKANDVEQKVEEMKDGSEFLVELQERIDAMETALAKFRLSQREQFETYVLEEKVLEKELSDFLDKILGWEEQPAAYIGQSGAARGQQRLALTRVASKSNVGQGRSNVPRQRSSTDNNADEKEGWEQMTTQNGDRPGSSTVTDEVGMVQHVRRLNDAILHSGGLKGGWDDREHAIFTRLLLKTGLSDTTLLQYASAASGKDTDASLSRDSNQHSHDEHEHEHEHKHSSHSLGSKSTGDGDYDTLVARFLRRCMRKIVTQTESSVRAHFEWYLQHISLVEEKKRVIHEWKLRKEQERRQLIQCGLKSDSRDFVDPNGKQESLASRLPHEIESKDSYATQRHKTAEAKSRRRTDRLLQKWKQEKERKEREREERKRELRRECEVKEAKRRQEQLDTKQQVQLYKLQKEQETALLERSTRTRVQGGGDESPQPDMVSSSPTPNEDLVQRSRVAIEHAKARRTRLLQLEERKMKGLQLPPRPESAKEHAKDSRPTHVLSATEASRARDRSKHELLKKARERRRQNAHETSFPGEQTIPDVKIKSFGHVAIQPRAVPSWRKNM